MGGQRVERRLLGEDSRDGRTPSNVSGAEQERVSTGVDLELVPLAEKKTEDRCPSASKRLERVKGRETHQRTSETWFCASAAWRFAQA